MTSKLKPCRNCGGTESFSKEVDANGGRGPRLLPLGFFTRPKFHIRVCAGCGLVDWFVADRFLPAVIEKFDRQW